MKASKISIKLKMYDVKLSNLPVPAPLNLQYICQR